MQVAHGTLTVKGHFNTQLNRPREEAEAAIAEGLVAAWQQASSLVVESDLQTRRGTGGQSAIDNVVVPHSVCLRCHIGRIWTAESDHAWLDANYASQESDAGKACTATALRSLPTEALVDLRLRYRTLGLLFGLRDRVVIPHPADLTFPVCDELHAGHPAMEAVTESADEMRAPEEQIHGDPTERGPGDDNATFLEWGGPFLRAMLQGWWLTWRGRRARGDPLLDLLRQAQAAGCGLDPTGRVTAWMASY